MIACDQNYFWNMQMYKDLIDQEIDVKWFTPIIQGYIGIQTGEVQGRDLKVALISRRSI
jgi:hypothetical protein